MEDKRFWVNDREYELYEAASGDWCVSIYEYGKQREDFNCGLYVKALEFILADAEIIGGRIKIWQ